MAIGYALIVGLAAHFPRVVEDGLQLFSTAPPPPPVRLQPKRIVSKRPEGAAAPPNLRSRATDIVAPRPVVILVPPPIVAAIKPATASDATSGSTAVRGPGTGSGGAGDGFGSGAAGDGDGDGDGGDETPPRFVRGKLNISDLPQSVRDTSFDGTVGVRYVVAPDGRVPDCHVTHSSGNAEIDALTCRLIRERFRFKPSRDARGTPVYAQLVESHTWVIEAPPPRR